VPSTAPTALASQPTRSDRHLLATGRSVPRIRLLLVEDNPVDAMRLRQLLARARSAQFEVDSVSSLDQACRRIAANPPEVILLDLDLPDSIGTETHASIACAAPSIPVIALCRGGDESTGIAAVGQGAQDFLMKQSVSAEGLARAIRCAIERHRVVASLRGLSLTDELTGLLNRRGFTTLVQGHLRLAGRTGHRFMLLYMDVDDLKGINDRFGHHQGDELLALTADALRRTFRQSDVVARFGGDEFVVLALDATGDQGESIKRRLEENIAAESRRLPNDVRLTLSVGSVSIAGASEVPLGALLARADQALYLEKRRRDPTCHRTEGRPRTTPLEHRHREGIQPDLEGVV